MVKPKRGEQTKRVIEYLKKYPERANNWVKHDTKVGLENRVIERIRIVLEETGEILRFEKRKGRNGYWYPRRNQTEAWHKSPPK